MGIGGDWLVRPERGLKRRICGAIDIARGSVVADIGAGAGCFTWRLAEPSATASLRQRLPRKNIDARHLAM
jgi:16S rRNA A1518/A1519 N6-dimethyltransferase RsmA/KsgA/DIM1 with predicted DNA glycosylase/AP lyase activity